MKVEIKVPPVGESVTQATVGQILKLSGTVVRQDEEILELETDKVNQPVNAPAAGKVSLTVKSGDVVKVGQVIGTIDSDVAAPAPTPAPAAPKEAPPAAPKEAPKTLPPARISVDQALAPEQPKPAPTPVEVGGTTRVKMTKLRRVIAQKLVEVKNQTAMLTTFNEVDMSTVISVREREKEAFEKKHGVRLGFMSFFVKAAVAALQQYPAINGWIEGDEIVYHSGCHVGVAVSTDKGLFVPVIRSADTRTYAEIEKQLKEYAEQARSGKLTVDALQGGTFTITNGGVFGSLLSTPILNPPQSGILGMHNIVKRPVVVDDQIVIRPMMYLALSYDHRIVDGKEAIGFLVHIKKSLEEPARLLLDL